MKKKFNIVDVVVILFVCAVVAFLGYKFAFGNNNEEMFANNKFQTKDVVYTIKVGEIIESTANALPESGSLFDTFETEVGNVLSKEVVESEVIKMKSDGEYIKVVNPGKKDVYLEVEGKATVKDEGYYVGTQVCLAAGSGATFKADDIEFWGYIMDVKVQ